MANECIPYYAGAEQITVVAGAAGVNGKRFVTTTGPLALGMGIDGGTPTGNVAATAGETVLGVGAQDGAIGLAIGVFIDGIVPVTTSAALTAGTVVMTDASGFATPWLLATAPAVNEIAGVCLGDTASGSDAPIKIRE